MTAEAPVPEQQTADRLSLAKALGISGGLAAMLLIEVWETAAQVRSAQSAYLSPKPPTPALEIAALLNALLFTGLLFSLIWVSIVRRGKKGLLPHYRIPVIAGLFVCWRLGLFVFHKAVPPAAFALAGNWVAPQNIYRTLTVVYVIYCVIVPAILVPAVIYRSAQCWRVIRRAAIVFLPIGAICAGQAGWQAIARMRVTTQAAAPARAIPAGTAKPLILWLIFDEMDQSATFSGSLGNLPLPNLSALRQVAVSADHACQVGDLTAKAIPAYTIGRKVVNVRWDNANDLMLKYEGSSAFVPWTRQDTIFHDARAAGRNTAILGYFHPYCRLFGNLMASCSVDPNLQAGGALMEWWSTVQSEPLYRSVLLQADRALPGFSPVSRYDGARFRMWEGAVARHLEREHERTVSRMRRDLLQLLRSPGIDFAFVHLPLPHPPGLHSIPGKEGVPVDEPGYAGNLRAADSLVGEIRQELISNGRWEETSLVITSDHTVRDFWSDSLSLSPSLARTIRSIREHTVPFLVKLPHQTQPLTYSEPFNAIVAHGIVRALLANELADPAAVVNYLRQNAVRGACEGD